MGNGIYEIVYIVKTKPFPVEVLGRKLNEVQYYIQQYYQWLHKLCDDIV